MPWVRTPTKQRAGAKASMVAVVNVDGRWLVLDIVTLEKEQQLGPVVVRLVGHVAGSYRREPSWPRVKAEPGRRRR